MGATVLLVDDEAELRALWREMLESVGHTCLEAGSVHDVRALVAGRPAIDIAIVDWTLPDGKGSAVRDTLIAAGFDIPLVFATGLGPVLPGGHGATRVLSKPFRMRALLDTVAELTD